MRLTRLLCLFVASSFFLPPMVGAQDTPIIQPGKPGEASRDLTVDEASDLAGLEYTEADARFMHDMIIHHRQAVEMSVLAPDRSNSETLRELAARIKASQEDEIAFMSEWLEARDESLPPTGTHEAMGDGNHMMAGMASPDEMERLAASEGSDFDRLFLELMVTHHEGALTMVDELLRQPGSARDPVLYEFVNDVRNDQKAEIERMNTRLASLSTDPRAGLAAGFRDAGEAISNMDHLASVRKPPGFFDPDNPAGLPMSRLNDDEDDAAEGDGEEADADADADADNDNDNEGGDEEPRPGILSFSNTDLAFAGDTMVAGNYHGFNIYDIGSEGDPALISSVVCPGGQGDVSIVGDLLIMSVEQRRGRLDCGLRGVAGDVSQERFRGLRIFDVSDLRRPVQVGAVQTCRGSHTHTVVSRPEDNDGSIIVYNSATSSVRDEEELSICSDAPARSDGKTALFRIDIIEIPVDSPGESRIVGRPFVFADSETGDPDGLWAGGDHGEDTQSTNETDHCHDITVFPSRNIAAGACSGNGILFDISDPLNPQRIDEVVDPGFAYWHSATFSNDGGKVIFTDEWGGGSRPRCRASDPLDWGADAIYSIEDGELVFESYYKMPAPQTEEENCVAHNGSIIPVPGRDIFVQSWYQGGISVVDFTDPDEPVEIAFFDRGPIDKEEMVMGGFWSAYWHDGRVFGSEIVRGLDVFALTPSEHLTANEIAAASLPLDTVFNPQRQTRIDWPAEPVVARAYLDQLRRDDMLDSERLSAIESLVEEANAALESGESARASIRELENRAGELTSLARGGEGIVARRLRGLADTLAGIAVRLR